MAVAAKVEQARQAWIQAQEEERRAREPFRAVVDRLMDLQPALQRAEQEVRLQTTLEAIEAARGRAEALKREAEELERRRADLEQVVRYAEARTREAEKVFRDLERRGEWLRKTGIPQTQAAIAQRRRLAAEAEAELSRRRESVTEGERMLEALRRELAELAGE